MRIDHRALRPFAGASRSGRALLESEVERIVDSAMAGPLPESVGRSLAQHDVLDRVVRAWLAESPDALPEAVDRIVSSPEFHRALRAATASPEFRAAIAQESSGFAEDAAVALRRRAAAWDDRLATVPSAEAGLVSRALALTVDALVAQLAFLVLATPVWLVASLFTSVHRPAAGIGASALWAVVVSVYLVAFWSTAGQTPGMRLLGLRVVAKSGSPPSVGAAVVRLVGLVAGVAFLCLGLVPIPLDRKRRGAHDFLAGTLVVR